jgi:MoxR-like ATPase
MDFSLCKKITDNISRVIVGKDRAIELLLAGLLAEGHVLIEDVPGVAKTLLAKTLARSIGGSFSRVQFTPDLLPADVTGFNVYDQKTGNFSFHPGPVITNVLLADEINRTIPRTQSSLLECMEERQVTVDGKTHRLPTPFIVMATQNPIELEGTFPLPEAQLDRFLLKTRIGYPDKKEEVRILERFQESDPLPELKPVASPDDIAALQKIRSRIRVSQPLQEYITDIVHATRNDAAIQYGASPRASLALMRTGQALAALRGRDYVLPDDIKYLAKPVLTHRLILNEEERLKGKSADDLIETLINSLAVPVTAG